MRRQTLQIEVRHRLLVDQDVAATQLCFQLLDLASQAPIVVEERRAQPRASFDQRFAHEDLAALRAGATLP